jgi:periplasmic divalent cation tolerance protein
MQEAETIAETLVTESLAACVNIIERCRSIYRWQGELQKDDEVLLLAKTERGRFAALEKRVASMHSYDVPEIIGVDVPSLSDGYRRFLEDVLGE